MSGRWLIGRQPILDRQERISAYELLFRASSTNKAEFRDATYATANVILGALSGFGMDEILGAHRGCINVDQELLFNDSLGILPPQRIVLEILETVKPSDAVLQRVEQLKAAGFSLALDDHSFDPAYQQLYEKVDLIKIDLVATPADSIAKMVGQFRSYPRLELLAEKVETSAQFRQCLDLGFKYFQGYYFAKPSVMERKRIDDSIATLLKLLRLLLEDAEIRQIEKTFRESPGLTYKLLVLVNSVAFGFRGRINTVRHAITILGREQMRRWLQLALFASTDQRGLDDPLLDMAAVRATFMERLAQSLPALMKDREAAEQAFMAGILSLLDTIYSISMKDLIQKLHLSDGIRSALLDREGELGELLTFVEHMERSELELASKQLEKLGLTQQQAADAQLQAFNWKSGS